MMAKDNPTRPRSQGLMDNRGGGQRCHEANAENRIEELAEILVVGVGGFSAMRKK
jgi:hypothetical protein